MSTDTRKCLFGRWQPSVFWGCLFFSLSFRMHSYREMLPAILHVKLLSPEFRVQTQKTSPTRALFPRSSLSASTKVGLIAEISCFQLTNSIIQNTITLGRTLPHKNEGRAHFGQLSVFATKKEKTFPCESHCTVILHTIKISDMLFLPLGCLLFTVYLHGCFVWLVSGLELQETQ